MLQIDHIYEFLYKSLFKDFQLYYLKDNFPKNYDIKINDISIFTPGLGVDNKIFFYDQEPFIDGTTTQYLDVFNFPTGYTVEQLLQLNEIKKLPYGIGCAGENELEYFKQHPDKLFPKNKIIVSSEKSNKVQTLCEKYNFYQLYYFFHGFAALDWYRGYYALNYNDPVIKEYKYDYITFNRLINQDRSYRIYFVSLLSEQNLLEKGLVSFNVTDNLFDDWRDEVADTNTKLSEKTKLHIEKNLTKINKLVIDRVEVHGSASADIPRVILSTSKHGELNDISSLWHIVTETVFYYDKLHLTEKIFKPIVSKQPFMLLAAPGNLEYLRSNGFKTLDGIIDESYDSIQDNDQRIEAVTKQLYWYCNLTQEEKSRVIERLAPIVEYNFHHFYGAFRHIITKELLTNCQALFKNIGYDDSNIAYNDIYRVLTN